MSEKTKPHSHSEETRGKISRAKKGKKNPALTTHGLTGTSVYKLWTTMKTRCNNPHRKKYKDYGQRGIKICDEWERDAGAFARWAFENGYAEGLQIDRIDNDGNYEPNNCRFVTPKQNSRNRRNTKLLTIKGETKSVAEWCETIDISQFTIYWWIREKGVNYAEQRLSEIA